MHRAHSVFDFLFALQVLKQICGKCNRESFLQECKYWWPVLPEAPCDVCLKENFAVCFWGSAKCCSGSWYCPNGQDEKGELHYPKECVDIKIKDIKAQAALERVTEKLPADLESEVLKLPSPFGIMKRMMKKLENP